MISRSLVAGSVLVFGLALVFGTIEASARSGGFGGARGGGFGGMSRGFARPVMRVAPRPMVGRFLPAPRPGMRVAPVARHGFVGHRGFDGHRGFGHRHGFGRHDFAGRNRRDFDNGTGVSVIYGTDPYGDPTFWGDPSLTGDPTLTGYPPYAAAPQPEAPAPVTVQSFAAAGRICRATVQVVPSESRGSAEVRVTRCYPAEEFQGNRLTLKPTNE
jgi:hypothetical protein